MLTHLVIQNYTIVSNLELELKRGLTAITGETGAGKSIMLDALSLVLGGRANADCVKVGAKQAQISAQFDISQAVSVKSWLQSKDLSTDECLLRRVISSEGRSRSYINGTTCTLTDLQSLGDLLLDLHSQHQHQSLLKTETHRHILDNFAQNVELAAQVKDLATKYHHLQQQIRQIEENNKSVTQRIDFLQFELDELERLNLQKDEVQSLEQEFKQLNSAHELLSECQHISELYDNQLTPSLSQILRKLQKLSDNSSALNESYALFETAQIQIDEAFGGITNFLADFAADPVRLQQIEARLAIIYQLARKHAVEAEQLLQVQDDIKQELARLAQTSDNLNHLTAQLPQIKQEFHHLASKLSDKRKTAADDLRAQVTASLHNLGMQNAVFKVSLLPNAVDVPNANGLENVEFLVTTNPGQPVKSLLKVASGGELSRISLAIEVIAAQSLRVATLIFDEVDVGIGGPTAEIVGQMLRKLGEKVQVITVTHLAQVAAYAHQNLRVTKSFSQEQIHVDIDELDAETRVHELARMLGGIEITKESLAHAKSLIERV